MLNHPEINTQKDLLSHLPRKYLGWRKINFINKHVCRCQHQGDKLLDFSNLHKNNQANIKLEFLAVKISHTEVLLLTRSYDLCYQKKMEVGKELIINIFL